MITLIIIILHIVTIFLLIHAGELLWMLYLLLLLNPFDLYVQLAPIQGTKSHTWHNLHQNYHIINKPAMLTSVCLPM